MPSEKESEVFLLAPRGEDRISGAGYRAALDQLNKRIEKEWCEATCDLQIFLCESRI